MDKNQKLLILHLAIPKRKRDEFATKKIAELWITKDNGVNFVEIYMRADFNGFYTHFGMFIEDT